MEAEIEMLRATFEGRKSKRQPQEELLQQEEELKALRCDRAVMSKALMQS